MSAHEDTVRIGPLDDPDKYGLGSVVAAGAQGAVHRGWVEVHARQIDVAIKIIKLAPNEGLRKWQIGAVRQEADLLRSVTPHPSIIRVRESFVGGPPHYPGDATPGEPSACYLVMDWADGESLATWVPDHPDRSYKDVFQVVQGIAAGLDHLHAGEGTKQPVFHRDIKPANVIVGSDLSVKLVDFGIAAGASLRPLPAGTLGYWAPELRQPHTDQFGRTLPAAATVESELFSLAAVAHWLFTGQHPAEALDRARLERTMCKSPLLAQQPQVVELILAGLNPSPSARTAWIPVTRWAAALQSQTTSSGLGQRATPAPATIPAAGPVPLGPNPSEQPAGARVRRGRRWLLPVAALLLAAVLGGAAIALTGGNEAGRSDNAGSRTTAVDATTLAVEPTESTAGAPAEVPGVVGKDKMEAVATLEGAGFEVEIVEEQSSDPEGTVLGQSPSPGEEAPDAAVTITVAVRPERLADYGGQRVAEAVSDLEALGVMVTIVDETSETEVDGTVIAQDPAPGSPIGDTVELRVARAAVVTYLADLIPVEGFPDSGSANVSGTTYARSILVEAFSETASIGYDLGRHYQRFRTTAGVSDQFAAGSPVKFEVFGDGRPLFDATLTLGQPAEIDVDVTGVLRLSLTVTAIEGLGACCSGYQVFGDAIVVGASGEVPEPAGGG